MCPKSRNDLMWSCCGEDKRARCKKTLFCQRFSPIFVTEIKTLSTEIVAEKTF